MAAAAVLVAIVAIAAVYLLFLSPNPYFAQQIEWKKVGAYATYSGGISLPQGNLSLTMRMEVIDMNATHVQVLMTQTYSVPGTASVSNNVTAWVTPENLVGGLPSLNATATLSQESLAVRGRTFTCNVTQFRISDFGSMTITEYVEARSGFPLKFGYSFMGYQIDLVLVDTNVQGLA